MAKIKSSGQLTKKDVIRDAAAKLIKEKGYTAASMRDLADVLGVEAPSLYNHIKSKSELLREIIFKTADECNEQLEIVEKSQMSCLGKIEAVIRFHVQMMLNRVEDYHVMTHEWIHLTEPHLTNFITQRRTYVQKLEAIVAQGIKDKEIKPVIPYVAVLNILSAVRGIEFWHRSQKRYSPEEIEENMLKHLLYGLKD